MSLVMVIGNRRYSSWSLRGWLAARMTGENLKAEVVWLDRPDTRAQLLASSPSARVPVLLHEGRTIWDSLAISLYLHRHFPSARLLPDEPDAEAHCLSIVAEMHAGFDALRQSMPMDLLSLLPGQGRSAEVDDDIARIVAIWEDCRHRFGTGGPFLFGAPSLADCFFAPVATRFVTYAVELPATAAAYRDSIVAWEPLQEWTAASRDEPLLGEV